MKKIALYILGLLLTIGFSAQAQLDRSKLPEPGPAPEIRLGEYESFTLKNGLKVFVVRNTKLPQVSVNLLIDRDPIAEGDKAGYIGLAGELLRSGTTNRSKDQLDEEIDFIGANLSTGSTSLYGSALSRHKEKLMELMADVLLNPSFPQSEFDRLVKQTKSGLAASKDDPDYIASTISNITLYGNEHPYGEPSTEATVDNITLADVKEYYNTYFKPNVAYLAIVGDITTKEAKKLTKKFLGDWKKGTVPSHSYEMVKVPESTQIVFVNKPNAVQSVLEVSHPVRLQPGSADVIPASVMNDILGGGSARRLFNNLRETKGYTYGAYSSLNSDELVGKFEASAKVRNEVTDSAVYEFMKELKLIRNEKVSAEELQKTKSNMTGNFARSLESPQTIARFALNIARYNLDKDYYRNYLKTLNAVTVDDVQRMAQKYINPDNAYVVVVGDANTVAPTLTQFGELRKVDMYGEPVKELEAGSVSVDEVMNKYIAAIGGKAKAEAITDVSTELEINVQGRTITIKQVAKMPGSFTMEQSMGGMTMSKQVVKDGTGFVVAGGQRQDMPEEAVKAAVYNIYPFPELKVLDGTLEAEVTGMEKVGGQDAYVVNVQTADGSSVSEYYAKDTGLKVKSVNQGSAMEITEYQTVDGIQVPKTIKMTTPMGALEAQVKSMEFNTNPADSVFE
jgi:predicted Zn-dependent peptidase